MSDTSRKTHNGGREIAIDALRGMVMIIMLLDHTRERFFLQYAISDPVDYANTEIGLYFTRLLSSLCAPVFVLLAGISAWFVSRKQNLSHTSFYLVKRGVLLILLEVTLVGLPWYDSLPPHTIWLQVIWAIGFSMIALAGLLHLPRKVLLAIAIGIICGHNLLDGVQFTPGSLSFMVWALLHDRTVVQLGEWVTIKTTYPVLPWIGVIALGYCLGPWYLSSEKYSVRLKKLFVTGASLLAGFIILRGLNVYGDLPWKLADTPLKTIMSFFALTKYPPSLLFLLFTLGIGILILRWFEQLSPRLVLVKLANFGSKPMFFYVLHLYTLKVISLIFIAFYGTNYESLFVFDNLWAVWLMFVATLFLLFFTVDKYSKYSQQRASRKRPLNR